MGKVRYAKDYKCVDCGKQAVAFFPVCDPDIPSYPMCRECIDKFRMRILKFVDDLDKKSKK